MSARINSMNKVRCRKSAQASFQARRRRHLARTAGFDLIVSSLLHLRRHQRPDPLQTRAEIAEAALVPPAMPARTGARYRQHLGVEALDRGKGSLAPCGFLFRREVRFVMAPLPRLFLLCGHGVSFLLVTCARPNFPPRAGEADVQSCSRGASVPEFCQAIPKHPPQKREAERRQAQPSLAASADAAAGLALTRRARLSALHHGFRRSANALTQPRPRFTRERGCGRYTHHQLRLSEAPRTPDIMPVGTMPGPPGSGVTSPARGNRTRSMFKCVSRTRPSMSKMRQCN